MFASRVGFNRARIRRRGSVYIMVLGAAMLVAVIGVSSLLATRVQRESVTAAADRARARELARTAADRGLWEVQNNALAWRTVFAAGTLNDVPFGGGTFSIVAVDLTDDDLLNNNTDPVLLLGVGKSGSARYILSVWLDGDGTPQPGTWRRVVI